MATSWSPEVGRTPTRRSVATWDYDIATDTWTSEAGHARSRRTSPGFAVALSKLWSYRRVYYHSVQSIRRDFRRRELRPGREHVVDASRASITQRSFPGGTAVGNTLFAVGGRDGAGRVARHGREAGCSGRPASTTASAPATTASAATTSASAATTSASTTTTSTTSATTSTASTASTTAASAAASASGSLSCPESARVASRTPRSAGSGRRTARSARPPRSLEAFVARPCGEPVTAARHDQAPELPGEAGGRSKLGQTDTEHHRGPSLEGGPLLFGDADRARISAFDERPTSGIEKTRSKL